MYLYGCQVLLLGRRRLVDEAQPVGVPRVAGVQDVQHVPLAAADLEGKQWQRPFVSAPLSDLVPFCVLAGRPRPTPIKAAPAFPVFLKRRPGRRWCGDSRWRLQISPSRHLPPAGFTLLSCTRRLMDVEHNQISSGITGKRKGKNRERVWKRSGSGSHFTAVISSASSYDTSCEEIRCSAKCVGSLSSNSTSTCLKGILLVGLRMWRSPPTSAWCPSSRPARSAASSRRQRGQTSPPAEGRWRDGIVPLA